MPWSPPSAESLKSERNPKNVSETLNRKPWEVGSYCSVEAACEGFQLSAAKTSKSSSESTCVTGGEGQCVEDVQRAALLQEHLS